MKQALLLAISASLSFSAMALDSSTGVPDPNYLNARLTAISCQVGRDVSSSVTFETKEKNFLGNFKSKTLKLTFTQCYDLMTRAGGSLDCYGESHADITTTHDKYGNDPSVEIVLTFDNIKNDHGQL